MIHMPPLLCHTRSLSAPLDPHEFIWAIVLLQSLSALKDPPRGEFDQSTFQASPTRNVTQKDYSPAPPLLCLARNLLAPLHPH